MAIVKRCLSYSLVLILLNALLPCHSMQKPQMVSLPMEDEIFTVAIFEHARPGNLSESTPEKIVQKNLGCYEKAAKLAKKKGADIIVFPEYGLFPFENRERMKHFLETVPDPKAGLWNPCIQKRMFSDRPMLRNLSCMAMKYEIVILANTGDIQPCDPESHVNCPEDGAFHYNANVVFDRLGTIISRYRKEHLFFEPGMDLPQEPQDPFFTTDFGKFASFICFDSIFKHIVEAGRKDGVDGVFLSTNWVETLPFYNSIQYFQGWAVGNNVTFVVSNMQIPAESAVGSGVFAGRSGAVVYTFNPDSNSKLLVSKAPKTMHSKPLYDPESSIVIITSNGTEPYDERKVDFEHYLPEYCAKPHSAESENGSHLVCAFEKTTNYTFVKLTEPSGLLGACNNGMCCSLDYTTLGLNESFYMGVFNSTHHAFDHYLWCEEKCLVVRCDGFEDKKCSVFPTRSSTVFLNLELKANFTTPYIYPSVMRSGLRTAAVGEWSYDVTGKSNQYQSSITYTNQSPSNALLVASLNGRCYDRDPPYVR